MPIVQGTIGPITARKIRIDKLLEAPVTVQVPVPPADGVFAPQFVSQDPIVMTPETVQHAVSCAKRVVAIMGKLPNTPEAGDLVTMAFAILHYENKEAVEKMAIVLRGDGQ